MVFPSVETPPTLNLLIVAMTAGYIGVRLLAWYRDRPRRENLERRTREEVVGTFPVAPPCEVALASHGSPKLTEHLAEGWEPLNCFCDGKGATWWALVRRRYALLGPRHRVPDPGEPPPVATESSTG